MKSCRKSILASALFALGFALSSCHPSPAELLDLERQQRDAAAQAEVQKLENITIQADSINDTAPEEVIEVLEVDTPSSRLQQVFDAVTDTAFLE